MGTHRNLTWLQAQGTQGVCDMRAVAPQLAQGHAVQHLWRRLVCPHDGWAVRVTPCGQVERKKDRSSFSGVKCGQRMQDRPAAWQALKRRRRPPLPHR